VTDSGDIRSENVGMSNECEMKTLTTENLRFPVQRQS
jgi:hypothetical protein